MRDNLGPTKICGRLTDWLRPTKESYASSREFGGGVRAPFPTSGWKSSLFDLLIHLFFCSLELRELWVSFFSFCWEYSVL